MSSSGVLHEFSMRTSLVGQLKSHKELSSLVLIENRTLHDLVSYRGGNPACDV